MNGVEVYLLARKLIQIGDETRAEGASEPVDAALAAALGSEDAGQVREVPATSKACAARSRQEAAIS